jgi:hypothetical protein
MDMICDNTFDLQARVADAATKLSTIADLAEVVSMAAGGHTTFNNVDPADEQSKLASLAWAVQHLAKELAEEIGRLEFECPRIAGPARVMS